MIQYKTVLFCLVLTSLVSCIRSKEIDNLTGTWVLDSVLMRSGKYIKTDGCVKFKFSNSGDYNYKSECGCVHQNFEGKYFILENPKRGLKTITLIPNLDIFYGDTVRTGYRNFDIVKLTNKKLVIVEESTFIDSKNLPSIIFNEKSIYKRIK